MMPLIKKRERDLNMTELIFSCCEELNTSLDQLRSSISRYEDYKKNKDNNKEDLSKPTLELLNDRRD